MANETPSHRQFFGDAERTFLLTPDVIVELERITSAGIGSLCKRLFAGQFHHGDVVHTIRLALIGGGETPQVAASLVDVYAAKRPLIESYPVAVSILETAWFGRAQGDESVEAEK